MLEMYTITGGAWFRESFNAIAAFMGTSTWTAIYSIAMVFSVILTVVDYMRRHDVTVLFYWAVVIVVTNILVNVKKPIHIIDSSQPAAIYQVDNVPVGLALPAHLFTVIGHGLLEGYERIFHLPDSVTYSKGGMLFGANLVVQSTDFVSANPEISGLFSDYVQNCVIGDIYLNHKYSLEDLMNSPDPYTKIFENPSPLRGVFNKNGVFQTCVVASNELTKALGLDSQTGGATWNYYVRAIFGGRPDADLLFSELMGNSYQHFYGTSQSASEIMKKNVTMNALRKGITSYASRNGDSAGLLNLSETSAMSKLRLSQATSGEITARQLPIMQTVVLGILIGLFPIIVLLGLLNVVTIQVWKGYIATIIWLQSWPILYAILNYAMTFNLRQQLNGQSLSMSSISTLQQNFSDIATMSAWISGFIPFLSYSLIYGLGKGFSQAGSYMGTATQGAATQASSQATDGTWAFNNMQTDNVQGHKWDTNSATSAGQMSSQTVSGGSMTRTAGGNTVYNSSGAMSQLPVHIGWSSRLSSAYQQQARESQSQATSFQKGYNDGLTFNANQATQLSNQLGNSSSMSSGFDSTEGSSKAQAFGKMDSIAEQYAKSNNISKSQAFSQLMDMGTRGVVSGTTKAGVKASAALEFLGSGGGIYGDVSATGTVQGSTGSSHGTDERGSQSTDSRSNRNAQLANDFRESMDIVASEKVSSSGSNTENNSVSKLDQFGSSLNQMKNDFEQYSSTSTRSKEYSELASRSKDTSANVESNYDQQFADYVTKHSPENAHDILTNTSSPQIARERENLAQQFVEQELAPRVADAYHNNRDFNNSTPDNGTNISSPSSNTGSNNTSHNESNTSNSSSNIGSSERVGAMENFNQSRQKLDDDSQSAGIKGNIKNEVQGHIDQSRSSIDENRSEMNKKHMAVSNEYNSLGNEHKASENDHATNYNKERVAQGEKPIYDDIAQQDPRNKEPSASNDKNKTPGTGGD